MPFEPGHNYGKGRPKGARNKMSQAILDNYLYILHRYNNADRIIEDLDNMSPVNRRKILEGMTKYVLPTLTKSESMNYNEGITKIVVEYGNNEKQAELNAPNPVLEIPPQPIPNMLANDEAEDEPEYPF